MAEKNKSYRIRTTVGREADSFLDVHLDQDYDSLEILSLTISDKDTYKLHNSDYGVVVGRVLANGNFGVPNAKISVFIAADEQNSNLEMWNLYPYTSTSTKNEDDIRYNLLPDESVKDCHKAVGTFPHKTLLLENDAILEVFDKYYVYTTRTNNAGDYLICGVPTGMQTLHMDLDLSDCGILSQRPRDFVYKGYTMEQFDNPNQFKKDENIDSLAQIFSQDQPVYVQPFWGNEDNGETIGITRADIQISFKFEPTCVFMGSAISDNASNGVGKKCVPTNQMGAMDELTAGEGTIEMIRKTPGGHVEEFPIKGNQLIDGNGVWCYQIPMNLDYMMTDEYGNMVPTDDPEKGIPTRARVRFRASLTDMEGNMNSYYRAKYLIPNNPNIEDQKVDYNFGTYTEEDSYRDLFWNGVYTVKSYIPRFQKSKRWRSERFSGIKACNYYAGNNPMPYNNMRIKLPFMFTVLCIFVKLFIKIVTLINRIIAGIIKVIAGVIGLPFTMLRWVGKAFQLVGNLIPKVGEWGDSIIAASDSAVSAIMDPFIRKYAVHCTFIGDGLCPDMEGWYFAPGCTLGKRFTSTTQLLMENTLAAATGSGDNLEGVDKEVGDSMNSRDFIDETSIDVQNTTTNEEQSVCLTRDINYLLNCFEMNLAEEYRVIKFDFYNDWVNGVIYFPRWMRKVKRKKKYRFHLKRGQLPSITTYYKDKIFGCMNADTSRVKKSRYYTQQCSLSYAGEGNRPWTEIKNPQNCYRIAKMNTSIIPSKCHKKQGMDQSPIFGKKSGLVTEETTMLGQFVYYLKPCEWKDTDNGRVRTLLFATDIVLLGTLNDCDENGIPQAFKYLSNSSYIMPTNLALTTMDDDAYIYAGADGTVCSSKPTKSGSKKIKLSENEETEVLRVTPDYESTNIGYSKTDGDQVDYGENDDPIPVTEAAGISWNYAGPGQDDVNLGKLESSSSFLARIFGSGNRRYDYLYYPGGHFLGLSCTNSDSNIKSCVNLKRICEAGATMSQRREELRGYTDSGDPKYRYYVPTGLISNVDIEGASFRSMFATLNHHKLVATAENETTGYKKYDFRFLRPDGFDGSLDRFVHKTNSPYNKKVNSGNSPSAITDASNFFERVFKGIWEKPDDYDELELEYTERRTVEDSIDDYYMFRFGINGFSNKEQRKHYLRKRIGGYILPQYENSFYFYFGLKDGSTALDEFKKQFFSECASNNVMKAPSIEIKEKIDENLNGTAKLIINNMIPPYVITVKDNTLGSEYGPKTFEKDSIPLERLIETALTIGHEYTVIVTDSLDHTLTKTFVFGASAVRVEAQTVHFRVQNTMGPTNNPQKGGYIKINDNVTILKKNYTIGNGVSFKFRKIVDGQAGQETEIPSSTYTDAGNENWHLYYVNSGTGIYEALVFYNGALVSVYTTTIEDNRKVNLFVACDYLAYKQEFDVTTGNYLTCCNNNNGLKAYSDGSWENGAQFQQDGGSVPAWENWLMRHTYYRQTENDNLAYDNYIYTKSNCELAIFGQAERGNRLGNPSADGLYPNNTTKYTYYKNDYNQFPGYLIDDTYNFVPSMYFNPNTREETSGTYRQLFDAMSYTDDGRAAADATSISITSYNYSNGQITMGYGGGLSDGHGCVVVFENGSIVFPVVHGSSLVAYGEDVYPNATGLPQFSSLLAMATVYPTLRVPSMYKPFYGIVSAVCWNVQDLTVGVDNHGETAANKMDLPLSYKVEGDIYNGLTYRGGNGRFYSGETADEYETYLIFKDRNNFWTGLTADTSTDWQCKRKIFPTTRFGQGSWTRNFAFGREIVEASDDTPNTTEIAYAVKEAIPTGVTYPKNVLTERYEGGFDQALLKDSCEIGTVFYSELQIKAETYDGLDGNCRVFTEESVNPDVELRLCKHGQDWIFNIDSDPLMIRENGTRYCYGYYNKNAEYDTKGAVARVVKRTRYQYSITQKNGTVTKKKESSESDLFDKGITLLHQYTIKSSYAANIANVSAAFNRGTVLDVSTKNRTGFSFSNSSSADTIIARYIKEDNDTKNELTIYKLYPVGSLTIIYPEDEGGIGPYISAPTGASFTKDAQTSSLEVETNVSFKATSDCGWITIASPGTYDPTASSIQFSLATNDTGGDRVGHITLECTDSSVDTNEIHPHPVVITITQFKDEIGELQDQIDNMEGQIQELSGNTGSNSSSSGSGE